MLIFYCFRTKILGWQKSRGGGGCQFLQVFLWARFQILPFTVFEMYTTFKTNWFSGTEHWSSSCSLDIVNTIAITIDSGHPWSVELSRSFWRERSQGYKVRLDAKFWRPFIQWITWAGTGLILGYNRRKCVLVICSLKRIAHWWGFWRSNWIKFGRDCKD